MQGKTITVGTKDLALTVGYNKISSFNSDYQDPEITFSIMRGHYTGKKLIS